LFVLLGTKKEHSFIRWGAKNVLNSGSFLVLATMIGVSASSYFWMICLFMFLSSAGSSLILLR